VVRGVQYPSIHYAERLAEAGIESSVGSVGDSYDNALTESVIGLCKTEVIRHRGRGAIWKRPSSPRSNGSTGSTTEAATPCRARHFLRLAAACSS